MRRDRRRFLALCGGWLSLLGGCAGAGGDDATTTTGGTPDPTGTPTRTSEPTPTPAPTATASATSTPEPTPATTPTPTPEATPTPEPTGPVELTITNRMAGAWVVTADSSGAVAPTGESNPTLTLATGRRYRVTNDGWSAHPFALRDGDGAALLSQDDSGRYGSDAAVDWTDGGETFAFTVTEALAADVASYRCTVHAAMRGRIETETG